MADCLGDTERHNRILPIGGPGPAITPEEQGRLLCEALGRAPRYRRVPVALMDAIVFVLGLLGRVVPRVRDKAEFARIGRYYATESMLVCDAATGRADPEATPSFGAETLRDFYARVARDGLAGQELGDHAFTKHPRAADRGSAFDSSAQQFASVGPHPCISGQPCEEKRTRTAAHLASSSSAEASAGYWPPRRSRRRP